MKKLFEKFGKKETADVGLVGKVSQQTRITCFHAMRSLGYIDKDV